MLKLSFRVWSFFASYLNFNFSITVETMPNLPLKPLTNGQHANGIQEIQFTEPQLPTKSMNSSFMCDWLVGHRLRALLVKNFIRMWRNLGWVVIVCFYKLFANSASRWVFLCSKIISNLQFFIILKIIIENLYWFCNIWNDFAT